MLLHGEAKVIDFPKSQAIPLNSLEESRIFSAQFRFSRIRNHLAKSLRLR